MQDLTNQMMSMQVRLHRQLMKGLEQTELTTGQPKVLAYLKSHEGLCQKEIAQACQLEPGSLTVLLNRMEKLGMIERQYREGDRKTRYIYLTNYGHTLAAQVVDRFYEVERLAFTGISEEEQAVFAKVCGEILENLKLG